MKQIRAIRISFLICAAVAVAAYWAGYYFGNTGTDPAELVTENTTDIYQEEGAGTGSLTADGSGEDAGSLTSESCGVQADGEEADTDDPAAGSLGEYAGADTNADGKTDAVESMADVSPDTYYLKKKGSYLAVCQGESGDVYFNTGIRFDELPDALQQEAAGEGIAFEDLDELFGFLENYSS